jgi:hypothetical protein
MRDCCARARAVKLTSCMTTHDPFRAPEPLSLPQRPWLPLPRKR